MNHRSQSGAKAARSPDASRLLKAAERREASGLRRLQRRSSHLATASQVQGFKARTFVRRILTHQHFALRCATLICLLALTSAADAATVATPVGAKKTYIVGLKDTAWKPTRAELLNGASPVQYYLLAHNLYVPEENKLHFLNEFIIDLDDTEFAALFNREWTGTAIQDASGRVVERHTRQAGKTLTQAEIAALRHPAKGRQANHWFENFATFAEDSGTVGLCAVWPTNGFPTRPLGSMPTNYQAIGVSLQRMNVGTTNGFLPWATSPFPEPYLNGQFKPLCYPGTTNRIGVAVLDSGIDAYSGLTNAAGQSYKHPDLEDIPYNTNGNGICSLGIISTNCAGSHSYDAFEFGYRDPNTGSTVYLPPYVDVGNGNGFGHGTAVASVIAAQDNGFGIVGIAPGVEIWNVRCLGPAPFNTFGRVHLGMNFVLAHADQIAVANMSFVNVGIIDTGTGSNYQQLYEDMLALVQAGVVLVAAAGNEKTDIRGADGIYGTGDDKVPAAFPTVISVSGMDAHDGTFYGWNPASSYTHAHK